MENENLKIGEVAKRTGIGVETIRFYEREGVLPRPKRKASGYRMFNQATIDRLVLIKRVQALGFSLAEVTKFLKPGANGALRKAIDQRIAELQAFRKEV